MYAIEVENEETQERFEFISPFSLDGFILYKKCGVGHKVIDSREIDDVFVDQDALRNIVIDTISLKPIE